MLIRRIMLLGLLIAAVCAGVITSAAQSTPPSNVEVTSEITAEASAEFRSRPNLDVTPESTPEPITLYVPEVISVRPHDPGSYTQGLLIHEGLFYESAGQYGESDLRQVDPETGAVLKSMPLADEYWAEGLTLVDDRFIQLTWKENTAFVYDLETFEQVETFSYEGEGWGLCSDGEYLYMSDGSQTITRRDPETFDILEVLTLTIEGTPVSEFRIGGKLLQPNELECVGDTIYANLWLTDFILMFNKTNGQVNGLIFAGNLLTEEEKATVEVLNGIAYDPENEVFYLTGKYWPKLFEVTFIVFDRTR